MQDEGLSLRIIKLSYIVMPKMGEGYFRGAVILNISPTVINKCKD